MSIVALAILIYFLLMIIELLTIKIFTFLAIHNIIIPIIVACAIDYLLKHYKF